MWRHTPERSGSPSLGLGAGGLARPTMWRRDGSRRRLQGTRACARRVHATATKGLELGLGLMAQPGSAAWRGGARTTAAMGFELGLGFMAQPGPSSDEGTTAAMLDEEGSESPWVFEGRRIGACLRTNKKFGFARFAISVSVKSGQRLSEVATPMFPLSVLRFPPNLVGFLAAIQVVPACSEFLDVGLSSPMGMALASTGAQGYGS
ncbi:hypothetical protein AMTR_s00033p00140540 [Amborella trichopoda]|uniref:Uncharacterized protein n=1 Tax=Amborella trichopoda TaxID=13333 RepID=U5CVT5_AMBTC|nr:hypothetical protein AMTR_s00033p00140540 [Amborella trichopoda]